MSGLLPIKFRTANRLEYLAHYILSKFGTAVPVIRTEDVGVDFFCSLGKDESVGITIAESFAVQLKSGQEPCLEFGGKTAGKKKSTWKDYEIKWFLNLEFPLLFGVPHEKEKRLDLYPTSLARFITYKKDKLPYRVRLLPGKAGDAPGPLHPDEVGKDAKIKKIPANCDGKIYEFKLGPPIISCTLNDLDDDARVVALHDRLAQLLKKERLNPIYRALSLPYWTWAKEIVTNTSHKVAFAYDENRTDVDREAVLSEVVPFICALGLAYSKNGENQKLEELKGIASQLPKNSVPDDVKHALPTLFP